MIRADDHSGDLAGNQRERGVGQAAAADLLGDAGDLERQQSADDLRSVIPRADAGAAAGDHHPGACRDRPADRPGDRGRVVRDHGGGHFTAEVAEQTRGDRAAAVGIGSLGHLVGDGDHRRPQRHLRTSSAHPDGRSATR